MSSPIEAARDAKAVARDLRKRGDTAAAIATLGGAIDELTNALDDTRATALPEHEAFVRSAMIELADLNGMIGGARREQGDLRAAAAAYDEGYRYESDPRVASGSSYNELNRLLTRALLCPEALVDADSLRAETQLPFVDLPASLRAMEKLLTAQVKTTRASDPWGAGDLALTAALTGRAEEMESALRAFEALHPPASVIEAYRHSFEALAAKGAARREVLMTAVARLDALSSQSQS